MEDAKSIGMESEEGNGGSDARLKSWVVELPCRAVELQRLGVVSCGSGVFCGFDYRSRRVVCRHDGTICDEFPHKCAIMAGGSRSLTGLRQETGETESKMGIVRVVGKVIAANPNLRFNQCLVGDRRNIAR